jgi:hypothetical protein
MTDLLITPDFTEETDMTPVPAGKYNARLIGVERRVGKTSGNPYLNWQAELIGAKDPKQNGKRVFLMTMFTGKAAGQIKELWKAATGETPAAGQAWDPTTLYGREISVLVEKKLDQHGVESKYPDVSVLGPKNPTLVAPF